MENRLPGELDPRLINLLKASLGLVDALRDIGSGRDVEVRLDRAGGLLLRQFAGPRAGNRIEMAGLAFSWPAAVDMETWAANDNDYAVRGGETPARG